MDQELERTDETSETDEFDPNGDVAPAQSVAGADVLDDESSDVPDHEARLANLEVDQPESDTGMAETEVASGSDEATSPYSAVAGADGLPSPGPAGPDPAPVVTTPVEAEPEMIPEGDASESIETEGLEDDGFEEDTDGDGQVDTVTYVDDEDGDGTPEAIEVVQDTDGDGVFDTSTVMVDADGDGVFESIEVATDFDGDGEWESVDLEGLEDLQGLEDLEAPEETPEEEDAPVEAADETLAGSLDAELDDFGADARPDLQPPEIAEDEAEVAGTTFEGADLAVYNDPETAEAQCAAPDGDLGTDDDAADEDADGSLITRFVDNVGDKVDDLLD